MLLGDTMQELENISSSEDLINKWRLAQGDLLVAVNAKGKISHAIPAKLTIIKELIRRGIFPYHYEIYGVGFLEMQNAFRGPIRAKCSAVLLEQWGIGVSSGQAAGLYLAVCRQLGKHRTARIEFLLEMVERRKKVNEIFYLNDRRQSESVEEFAKCFERLIEIMDAERAKLEEIEKK